VIEFDGDQPTAVDAATAYREPPRSGILNIDKPAGPTSHDVVQVVRRASGQRRVGHAGTLDPLATGVLLVCLGSATRVIDDLQSGRKAYRAEACLGVSTTTYDAEGEVVTTRDPSRVTLPALEEAVAAWRGEVLQAPPMHSAVHHEGRRLYEFARKGIEIERAPRPVTIHRLEIAAWAPPIVTLAMVVSKGTYVRSLVHDIGGALGVGAHLVRLRRTAVGPFSVEDAAPLSRVVDAFVEGWWPQLMHPLDAALAHCPALVVDAAAVAAIRRGQQVDGPEPGARGPRARAYDEGGGFIGILRWDAVTGRWQPDRVFPPPP
jgi:tRNA pseudouridine55 synthase